MLHTVLELLRGRGLKEKHTKKGPCPRESYDGYLPLMMPTHGGGGGVIGNADIITDKLREWDREKGSQGGQNNSKK